MGTGYFISVGNGIKLTMLGADSMSLEALLNSLIPVTGVTSRSDILPAIRALEEAGEYVYDSTNDILTRQNADQFKDFFAEISQD